MNAQIERIQLLLSQERYALAEQELWLILSDYPDHPLPQALLALCLSEQQRAKEALNHAQTAVHLAPDAGFCHYILAVVEHRNNHQRAARNAIDTALALDPESPEYFAFRGSLALEESRWKEALANADAGLALEAEHTQCLNLRSMALLKLGRGAEAEAAIDSALETAPEDATVHAQRGWTRLEKGQHQAALEAFQEALRLDPNLEIARSGMLEALKARYFLYRWMLRYFFWMGRFGKHHQFLVLLGILMGARLFVSLAREQDWSYLIIGGVLVLYFVFNLLSWVSDPLFNLLLRTTPYGGLMLSEREKQATDWFILLGGGGLLSIAITALCWNLGLLIPSLLFGWTGMASLSLLVPIAGSFAPDSLQARTLLGRYTLGLASIALLVALCILLQMAAPAIYLGAAYFFGWIAFSWIGNFVTAWKRA